MASNNPFFEPLKGDQGKSAPPSNVFAASPVEHLVKKEPGNSQSPFSLDEPEPEEKEDRKLEKLLWESVLSSLPQAVIVLDEQQNILYTNPAHANLLGVDAAKSGDRMEDWFRQVCPDPGKLAKIVPSWHEHIWRNQLTRTFSLTSTTIAGPRHIEFRSNISPDGNMIILQSDVTDDMASDEALRQANLKFRSLFSNSSGGIVVVNQEGIIHDLNNAFCEFAGKATRDLLGKPFLSILNPEDAASLRESEETDLHGTAEAPRKIRFLFEGHDRDRPALVTASYITNQNQEATLKLYQLKPRDAQLVAKLQELSSKAQSLLDSVPDMFVLLDQAGTIKDWSPPKTEWEVTLDFSRENIGQPARDVWPEFGVLLDANLDNVFESGSSLRQEISGGGDKPAFPVTLSPFGKDLALALIEGPLIEEEPPGQIWHSHFFTSASEAVLVTSDQGDVMEANPAASKMLGIAGAALTRSNLFQLVSKAPGSTEEFTLEGLRQLQSEKKLHNLLSVSPTGPRAVSATLIPVKDRSENLSQFVVIIQPKQVETLSEAEILELSQSQFRSQLQTITSLFSIAPDNPGADSFTTWLIRLKVLAESMTSRKRIGIVYLLRDIADQVSSVAGKGLGPREVVISGSSSLTIDNEIATPFALLASEVMCLGVCGSEKGPGPSIYLDVESFEGNILLTAKPGENRKLFGPDKLENTKVIEILVEQIRGKLSVGVGDENLQDASIRLSFPCQQS